MTVAAAGAPAPVAVRRRPRSKGLAATLWIAPAGLVIVAVFGYSLFAVFVQAFQYEGEFVGFENFGIVFADPVFRTALLHNGLLLLTVPVLGLLAFVIAVVLFETRRGLRFFRAVVFLPYVLAIPVVALVFGQVLQFNGGLNAVLRAIGANGLALDWLGDPDIALTTMAAVIVWKEVGFGVVLLLARLLSLSTEVYEAARLDGAGFWRIHWSISLPQVAPTLAFYAVVEAITMVSWVFNYVYVITNGQGGPGTATMITELYIYRMAFQYQSPELAAAAAVVLFLGTLVFVLIFFRMQRRSLAGTFTE